ncbi:MAG: hypothetical protein IJ068_01165 [Bacilli bacterium]|nr:hypothetical protein [Bacilli bacterium]
MKKLKQILSNKNTVTLVGAVLIVLVLYVFYNIKVNQATTPIRVPYAIQPIAARTKVTKDMIGYLEITQSALKGDIYTHENQIINNVLYTRYEIPTGSLFYVDALCEEKDLPDSWMLQMDDGMVAYNFDVTMKSTYGNSIYQGDKIDLYFRGRDDTGLVLVGKFLENVKVLIVKDSSGRNVFENTTEVGTPSQMILEVTEEHHYLLRAAEKINNVEIILVPSGTTLENNTNEKVQTLTSEEVKQYIETKSKTMQ